MTKNVGTPVLIGIPVLTENGASKRRAKQIKNSSCES